MICGAFNSERGVYRSLIDRYPLNKKTRPSSKKKKELSGRVEREQDITISISKRKKKRRGKDYYSASLLSNNIFSVFPLVAPFWWLRIIDS